MDIYFDLSFLLQSELICSLIFLLSILFFVKIKWYYYLIFSFFSIFLLYLIYFPLFINVVIYLLFYLLMVLIIFKQYFLKPYLLILLFDLFFKYLLSNLNSYVILKNVYLYLNDPQGMLIYLFLPLFALGLYFSSLIFDSLLKIRKYKMQGILSFSNQWIQVSCYYDSGNLLKYQNIPIIFISSSIYPYPLQEDILITYQGINGLTTGYLQEGLITLNHEKTSHFIYFIVLNTRFHQCDVLLNGYL